MLTGKNRNDYERVASELVNSCDIALFKELVESDDFLFDFIKQNVADRLDNAINAQNYKNLLNFLKYYSPFYDDAIVTNLVKFADEDLTDLMLEKFERGSDDEKAYAAKYFGYIKDSLAYDFLIQNMYNGNEYVLRNCAIALSMWHDEQSYQDAILKLKSDDDFEKLSAVRFLTTYGRKDALFPIIEAMKQSVMSENIASELPYLVGLKDILKNCESDGLLVINNIINALGEIIPLSVVFDFELYEVFENLIHECRNGKCATVLLNAMEKFEILTENDEYLFDEDKNTQNEIQDIKKLLRKINKNLMQIYINEELREDSEFVYDALNFAQDEIKIRELLRSNNQTIVLKTAETLKKLGCFDDTAKQIALLKVTDINIKSIIRAM